MAVQPYRPEAAPETIPLSDAAELTLGALENLLRDWLQLIRLQASVMARGAAAAAGAFAAAGLLAVFAYAGTSVAVGLLLARWLPADGAAAIVAGLNASAAAALFLWARRQMGRNAKES